jgi:uncharacterized protein YbjT (DUF2867 family)
VTILGRGTQRLAPLYRDDVVEAIVHAGLDPETPTGTFELAGPDIMSAQEFAGLLNTMPVRIRNTPVLLARLLGRIVPTLTPELVDVMLSDAIPSEEVTVTAQQFGIELRHVADLWGARARDE